MLIVQKFLIPDATVEMHCLFCEWKYLHNTLLLDKVFCSSCDFKMSASMRRPTPRKKTAFNRLLIWSLFIYFAGKIPQWTFTFWKKLLSLCVGVKHMTDWICVATCILSVSKGYMLVCLLRFATLDSESVLWLFGSHALWEGVWVCVWQSCDLRAVFNLTSDR